MLSSTYQVAQGWISRLRTESARLAASEELRVSAHVAQHLTVLALRDWFEDLLRNELGESFDAEVIRLDRACTALFGEGA